MYKYRAFIKIIYFFIYLIIAKQLLVRINIAFGIANAVFLLQNARIAFNMLVDLNFKQKIEFKNIFVLLYFTWRLGQIALVIDHL